MTMMEEDGGVKIINKWRSRWKVMMVVMLMILREVKGKRREREGEQRAGEVRVREGTDKRAIERRGKIRGGRGSGER